MEKSLINAISKAKRLMDKIEKNYGFYDIAYGTAYEYMLREEEEHQLIEAMKKYNDNNLLGIYRY